MLIPSLLSQLRPYEPPQQKNDSLFLHSTLITAMCFHIIIIPRTILAETVILILEYTFFRAHNALHQFWWNNDDWRLYWKCFWVDLEWRKKNATEIKWEGQTKGYNIVFLGFNAAINDQKEFSFQFSPLALLWNIDGKCILWVDGERRVKIARGRKFFELEFLKFMK